MEKQSLRHRIRSLKAMLDDVDKLSAADKVFKRLEETAAFLMADNILMYHSLPDELETHRFLRKWKDRKNFFLPRVNGVNLDILPYDESRLELGSFHIEEPIGEDKINPDVLELIIVPGVAFDGKGHRLGRGKGFYDRLLSETNALKIGICYEFQLVDEVPHEKHDVAMDIVISENVTIMNNTLSNSDKKGKF